MRSRRTWTPFRAATSVLTFVLVLAAAPSAAQPAAAGAGSPAPAWTFSPPPCQGTFFADVNCSGQFDAWIEQYARDGITGGCGGGNYCPSSPVTRGQMAVFVEKAMRGASGWPPNTVLVHGVLAGDGLVDPATSGQALLDAVASIPLAGANAPSATNVWLVKIGPGLFDLGTQPLQLPAWVVLEGAGNRKLSLASQQTGSLTMLIGQAFAAPNGTVRSGSTYSEIRDLEIRNVGGNARAIAVYKPSAGMLVLRNVTMVASDGSSLASGLYGTGGGEVQMADSFVLVGGTATGEAIGVYSEGDTLVHVERSRIQTIGPTNPNGAHAVYIVAGRLAVTDSHIGSAGDAGTESTGVRLSADAFGSLLRSRIEVSCSGASARAWGLYPQSSFLELRSVRVVAVGSACESIAVLPFDSDVQIHESDLFSLGDALSSQSASAARNVTVHRSNFFGQTNALANGANYSLSVFGSFVNGSVTNAGTLSCVASYDTTAPLGANCQ